MPSGKTTLGACAPAMWVIKGMKRTSKSLRLASSGKVLLPFLAWALFPALASAQYRAVILQPDGYAFSVGLASDQGYQAGYAGTLDQRFNHAIIWNGSAQNYVDLNPIGFESSTIAGAAGGQQVGTGSGTGINPHALLWRGTADSAIDLDPGVLRSSEGVACDGTQQVGYITDFNINRAALWSGTAASFVDLTPTGASDSTALAVDHGKQGGYARFGLYSHAAFWSGTAASFVDLQPRGFYQSAILGLHGNQAVGIAMGTNSQIDHAMYWQNWSDPPIELTPSGL